MILGLGLCTQVQVSAETRRHHECPRTGVKGSCERSDKSSGNSWVLCEMSMHG